MAVMELRCSRETAEMLEKLDGNQFERALTIAAQQGLDPAIIRVHSHDDGIYVEYADRVERYASVEIVPLLD